MECCPMKTKYTVFEVGALRVTAGKLNMQAPESFWTATVQELADVANGVGPDSWSVGLRKVAGKIAEFPISTLIHDWDFFKSNGHKKDWATATWRYEVNTDTEINHRWPFKWSWSRFMKRHQMYAIREGAVAVLELGSFNAWVECSKRKAAQ